MKKLVYYLTLACILVSGITALLFVLISYKIIDLDPILFTGFRIFNVILLLLLGLAAQIAHRLDSDQHFCRGRVWL